MDDEETELGTIAARADDYLVKAVLDIRQLQRALARARRPGKGDDAESFLWQQRETDPSRVPSVLITGPDFRALWSLNLMLRADSCQTGITSALASFVGYALKPDVVVLSLGNDFADAGKFVRCAQEIGCPTVALVPPACADSLQLIERVGVQTVLASPVRSGDLLEAVERAIRSAQPDTTVAQPLPA